MMDNDKAGELREISEDFPGGLPLHVSPAIGVRYEVKSGGTIRSDPKTAHHAAGDSLYEKSIPESCGLCQAQELAKAAARRAAQEAT